MAPGIAAQDLGQDVRLVFLVMNYDQIIGES